MDRFFAPTTCFTRRRGLAALAAAGAALALGGPVSRAQVGATATALGPGAAAWTKYNLNTITDEQILSIPGTGDRMTREFAEYRPYATIGQFRAEIGKYVEDDVVAGYEAYVFVPIDPANLDEDMLAQLPGVDGDKAAQLAGGGPYGDAAAFLAALAPLVSAEQADLAPAYLAAGA